jgi:hypothetical protein
MSRMIDQVRAFKLPSNMMQFAARGALAVPPSESIEIMVYLARHNQVFGDLARMTLAGWDEKSSLAAASDPNTPQEVLDYFISPENLRPKLLPELLENPSVAEGELAKFARSASHESIEAMLQSPRIRGSAGILDSLKSNPYLNANELGEVKKLLSPAHAAGAPEAGESGEKVEETGGAAVEGAAGAVTAQGGDVTESTVSEESEEPADIAEEAVSSYLAEHEAEIAADWDKPFRAIGTLELLGADYFPVSAIAEVAASTDSNPPAPAPAGAAGATSATAGGVKAAVQPVAPKRPQAHPGPKRENTLQKINGLDVKGRIQLALKGNKEERSLLIRDGTKVVALAVLEAPKLSDGEVEKFALQKNVLEAVLRQIPLKRRFMKNYIVVRNLVSNPRTPLDLGLGLMKHLLPQDLKNISANKEISETVRKLAMKMYKQKLDAAAKK